MNSQKPEAVGVSGSEVAGPGERIGGNALTSIILQHSTDAIRGSDGVYSQSLIEFAPGPGKVVG